MSRERPSPSTDTPALELSGVEKRFGDRAVFEDVDLRVAAGERVVLLGESGTGKSTLLNIAAGLDDVDAGDVTLVGHGLNRLDRDARALLRRRHVGFVFQAFHLLPYLDALGNVAVPLLLDGVRRGEAVERSAAMLERVGLGARAGARAAQLSGGEQQRVALARALVHRPQLVLADEPTGNLDAATARAMLEVTVGLLAASGAALLMVTHSEQAAAIADRQLVLVERRLVVR